MSTDLLPCPFCGESPLMQEIEAHSHAGGIAGFMPDHPGSFTIECSSSCGCGMIADTREQVTAAWNRRAALSAQAAAPADVKCWHCGAVIDKSDPNHASRCANERASVDLHAAIMALHCVSNGSTLPLKQHFAAGFLACRDAAADLVRAALAHPIAVDAPEILQCKCKDGSDYCMLCGNEPKADTSCSYLLGQKLSAIKPEDVTAFGCFDEADDVKHGLPSGNGCKKWCGRAGCPVTLNRAAPVATVDAHTSTVAQDERGQFAKGRYGCDYSAGQDFSAEYRVGRASVATPAAPDSDLVTDLCELVDLTVHQRDVVERAIVALSGPAAQPVATKTEVLPDHWRKKAKHIVDGSMGEKERAKQAIMLLEVLLIAPARPVGEAVAPWPDFAGNPIREGDTIIHPDGESKAVVMYWPEFTDAGDAWRARYDDAVILRLCGQIGDKGRAVVQQNLTPTAPPVAQDQAEIFKRILEVIRSSRLEAYCTQSHRNMVENARMTIYEAVQNIQKGFK